MRIFSLAVVMFSSKAFDVQTCLSLFHYCLFILFCNGKVGLVWFEGCKCLTSFVYG